MIYLIIQVTSVQEFWELMVVVAVKWHIGSTHPELKTDSFSNLRYCDGNFFLKKLEKKKIYKYRNYQKRWFQHHLSAALVPNSCMFRCTEWGSWWRWTCVDMAELHLSSSSEWLLSASQNIATHANKYNANTKMQLLMWKSKNDIQLRPSLLQQPRSTSGWNSNVAAFLCPWRQQRRKLPSAFSVFPGPSFAA